MLLANSSVRKAAKTARVYQYATRGSIQGIVGIALLQSNGRKGRSPFNGWRPVPPSLFIQNHCAKSENPWFFKTNSGNVNEPLMWEVRFLSETDNGDFRVCLIRFNPPFRLRPVFSSKIIAPNRRSWGFLKRTPEVLTNLSWEVRFLYWKLRRG